MRTSKPISTITWNSYKFLKIKLDENIESGKIKFWAAIHHLPEGEGDEGKEHYHIYIEPDGQIDTRSIFNDLTEFDINNPSKPIRPHKIENSKFDHWFLYGCHDPDYLRSLDPPQARIHHYSLDQFITSDEFELKRMTIEEVNRAKLCGKWKIIKGFFIDRIPLGKLYAMGYCTFGQYPMYSKILTDMARNGIDKQDIIEMYNLTEYQTKKDEKEHHKK